MGRDLYDYEDNTLAEINYLLGAYTESTLDEDRKRASLIYWAVSNLPSAIHEPKRLPKSVEDAFPGLFQKDRVTAEELQQKRFLEGVQEYNKRRK